MTNIPLAFVTFQPDKKFYSDLDRFLEHDQKVYIFCNCYGSYNTIKNRYRQNSTNIKYHYEGYNAGLSMAYNYLLDLIDGDGYTYFYLFDQDTHILDYFFTIKDHVPNMIDLKDVVLAQLSSENKNNKDPIKLTNAMFVINSGSLINVNLIKSLGGYPENYFVDGVDYYISLMAKRMNYRVGYVKGYFGLDHTTGQGDVSLKVFNKIFLVRYYGWFRIIDVSKSHLKLILISLRHGEFRYTLKLSQFLTIFYIKNILGFFLRK